MARKGFRRGLHACSLPRPMAPGGERGLVGWMLWLMMPEYALVDT